MVGNTIVTGDHNRVQADVRSQLWQFPPADSVNITAELAALRAILVRLGDEHAGKIGRALDDAEEEAQKPAPNKHEIGAAVTRALEYAKKSSEFLSAAGKLTPHLTGVVSWLGSAWHHLLPLVGIGRP